MLTAWYNRWRNGSRPVLSFPSNYIRTFAGESLCKKYTHSPATSAIVILDIRLPRITPLFSPPFCSQNSLIASWQGFHKKWKHSFEILVYVEMTASLKCCRFAAEWVSHSITSQRCSVEFHWNELIVHGTPLKWLVLCDIVHYHAGF